MIKKNAIFKYKEFKQVEMVDWFQGYVLGNPMTDHSSNDNYKIPFAYGMALISNELYKVTN